ncbi:MAG: MFS transporter [Dehalococcoidia bacterium]
MDLLGRIREDMALEANIGKSFLYRFLIQFQLWWPIWVIYLQKERDLSLTQITLLDTPFFLLIVFAEVPTGAIADRYGRRISLMLGSLMFAIAVFIFGVAENYLVILLSYTAWGLALTLQSGADTALLYDSLKSMGREEEFQKINGRLWALTSLAVLLAILIGAPIAAATSLSVPILLSAGVALAAVPVALSMREPSYRGHEEPEPYLRMVRNGVRDAWNKKPLRYIIAFSGVLQAAVFAPLIFLQPFLDSFDVGTGNLGLWQAPVRAAGMMSAFFAHRLISRLGERGTFLAMPVALGIAYLSLAGMDNMWVYAAFIPVGFVAGLSNPALSDYVNRRIPSDRRATMLSIQNLAGSVLLAFIEPISGALADTVGLRGMFLMFGVLTLVIGPAILWLWNRAESDELDAGSGQSRRATEQAPEIMPVS